MKLHSKFLRRWCGSTDAPLNSLPSENESDYGFLGYLWRADTAVDDALKLSYTLTLVYLRANVLIEAYRDHVSNFAIWLP